MNREKPRFFETAAAFRAWLEAHHARAAELLVAYYKKGTGKPSLTWPESVDEALCFGWIDGVRRSLSEDAYTIRFTPRKRGSHWSARNVARMAELERLGKMRAPGRAAFAARREDRTAQASFERETPAELTRAETALLRANKAAAVFFAAQAPWYQRTAKHWVVSAKRPETRARRLETLIGDSAARRTIKPLTRKAQ